MESQTSEVDKEISFVNDELKNFASWKMHALFKFLEDDTNIKNLYIKNVSKNPKTEMLKAYGEMLKSNKSLELYWTEKFGQERG